MFPEVSQVAEVVPVRFRAIISPAITPRDWIDLVNKISEIVSADPAIDGIGTRSHQDIQL